MKLGYKVLVTEDYYDDEYYLCEELLAPKGVHLTVSKFNRKDWMHNRGDVEGDVWYLSFEELDGCFYFPNDYMDYDHEFNRNLEIDKILI